MTESEALIALNLIPDIGSVRLRNLLEAFGSAAKIFLNSRERLERVEKIGSKIAGDIASFSFEKLKKELELSRRLKVKIITLRDKDYPENLKNIYDPPLCLYLQGELLARDNISLAVVGSRRASFYGLSCAEKFSYDLASLGLTIVSGLARGIDTRAHQGALRAKGRTLAVLGSGLNNIYPPENQRLADKIAESGALLSEFPLDYGPLGRNFPRRNRVISGLSLGVIVVEAARNSGALITSDFALEQGRSVFAVPGSVNSATSFGTNQLIKQGAKLVDSVEDIIEEIKPELDIFKAAPKKQKTDDFSSDNREAKNQALEQGRGLAQAGLDAEEKMVYGVLSACPSYVDEISEVSGLNAAKVMSKLLKLEMLKLVKQSPGKRFARV